MFTYTGGISQMAADLLGFVVAVFLINMAVLATSSLVFLVRRDREAEMPGRLVALGYVSGLVVSVLTWWSARTVADNSLIRHAYGPEIMTVGLFAPVIYLGTAVLSGAMLVAVAIRSETTRPAPEKPGAGATN